MAKNGLAKSSFGSRGTSTSSSRIMTIFLVCLVLIGSTFLFANQSGTYYLSSLSSIDSDQVLKYAKLALPDISTGVIADDDSDNVDDDGTEVDKVGGDTTGNSKEFDPLDCVDFLEKMKAGTHPQQVADPNNGEQYVKYTTNSYIQYPFHWSVHSEQYDPVRWGSYKQGYYYELTQAEAWVRILENSSNNAAVDTSSTLQKPIILDVGGNIGYYTLLTAAMGYTSHVFEPNNINLLRLCESVQYNKWEDQQLVRIHQVGISREEGKLPFMAHPNNPGAGSFEIDPRFQANVKFDVPVTTLDIFAAKHGWFNKPVTITILKVDVEGHEAPVILGANKLLQAHMVQNIFIEMRVNKSTRPALKLLLDAGYELYKYGAWMGPDKINKYGSGPNLMNLLFKNTTLFKDPREEYINMWWKLREAAAL